MNLTPNLFPLPTWAPAFQRVPTPLAELNEAFAKGEKGGQRPAPGRLLSGQTAGASRVSPPPPLRPRNFRLAISAPSSRQPASAIVRRPMHRVLGLKRSAAMDRQMRVRKGRLAGGGLNAGHFLPVRRCGDLPGQWTAGCRGLRSMRSAPSIRAAATGTSFEFGTNGGLSPGRPATRTCRRSSGFELAAGELGLRQRRILAKKCPGATRFGCRPSSARSSCCSCLGRDSLPRRRRQEASQGRRCDTVQGISWSP